MAFFPGAKKVPPYMFCCLPVPFIFITIFFLILVPDEPFIPAFMGGFSAIAGAMAIVMVVCMKKKQQQEPSVPYQQPGSQFMQGQQQPYPPQMQPAYPPQPQLGYPPQAVYPPAQFRPGLSAQPAQAAQAPRYCEHCGVQLQPGARVCQNCGSEFRER